MKAIWFNNTLRMFALATAATEVTLEMSNNSKNTTESNVQAGFDIEDFLHQLKQSISYDQFVHLDSSTKTAIAIILAFVGLVVWLLGYRLIKVAVLVAAFVVSCGSFYVFSPHVFDTEICCGDRGKVEARVAVSVLIGFLAAIVAFYVYRLGVFCMGFFVGLVVGLLLVALWLSKYLTSALAFYALYGGLCIFCGILAVVLEKSFMIISTSLLGSLAVFHGIDHFAKTGFMKLLGTVFSQTMDAISKAFKTTRPVELRVHAYLSNGCLAMLLGWLMMAVIGAMLQYVYTGQNISFKLMIKSCLKCEQVSDKEESDQELERKGYKYILIDSRKNGTMTARYIDKRKKSR